MKNLIVIALSLTPLFAQYEIEGRWHLLGYEDNIMYQFEDNYRYSIYSLDGDFGGLEDAGNSPNPYTVEEDTITINLFFGNIVNYQMNYICDGQVVEFQYINDEIIHSILFRENFDYFNSECLENSNDCSEMNETACTGDDDCEWIENIEFESCNDINNQQECYAVGCSWYNGNYYACSICCWGEYEVDNSYCEETEHELGDLNQDSDINIQDVILLVNLVLSNNYNNIADMNFDNILDILDIIQLVNIILN